jgi:hypothetical protein
MRSRINAASLAPVISTTLKIPESAVTKIRVSFRHGEDIWVWGEA